MVNQPSDIAVLYRGATGQLWLMRGNAEAPELVRPDRFDTVRKLLPKQQDQSFTFPVPKEVREILDDEMGPEWWCWVFCSAARMK